MIVQLVFFCITFEEDEVDFFALSAMHLEMWVKINPLAHSDYLQSASKSELRKTSIASIRLPRTGAGVSESPNSLSLAFL